MKPAKTLAMMIAAATTTRELCRKPVDDGIVVVGAVHVCLPHPGHQEDLVVHGQPEQDADQHDRQEAHHRAGRLDAEQVSQPAPLEHRDHRTEGGEHD